MEIINCGECDEIISDGSENCLKCGAAVISKSFWDINADGKIDFEDIKAISDNLIDAVGSTIDTAKNIFRSQAEKDLADVEQLANDFKEQQSGVKSESQLKRDVFNGALESTVDLKIAKILASKSESEKYLVFADAQIITAEIHNIFKAALSFTPRQVSAACALSKAILAPSMQAKIFLIKTAIGFAGGTIGIGMVIAAVGTALGWGASPITAITAVFVGSSIAGPIAWGVSGLGIAAIAGYFASSSNKEVDSERFINVLKMSIEKAVEAIWEEHGVALSKSVNDNSSTPEKI